MSMYVQFTSCVYGDGNIRAISGIYEKKTKLILMKFESQRAFTCSKLTTETV